MRLLVGALLTLTFGCGATPPRAATHSDFDAIQRQETQLELNARVVHEDTKCETRCPASARARDAAVRICEIAGRVADADATDRCAEAHRRAESMQIAVQSCSC